MNQTPCVFLVDDQIPLLKALSRLLASEDFEVARFSSAQDFLDSGNADALGCLVLDLSMPGMNGLSLQQELIRKGSQLPIIFLTGQGDLNTGIQAMKLGAVDFLTKPVDGVTLIAAVQVAIEKNRLARLEHEERKAIHVYLDSLTPRERDVMMQIVEGKLNKQVADALGIVEKTVKVHRARVMTKMKVASLVELVRLTDRLGIRPGRNNKLK